MRFRAWAVLGLLLLGVPALTGEATPPDRVPPRVRHLASGAPPHERPDGENEPERRDRPGDGVVRSGGLKDPPDRDQETQQTAKRPQACSLLAVRHRFGMLLVRWHDVPRWNAGISGVGIELLDQGARPGSRRDEVPDQVALVAIKVERIATQPAPARTH